MELACEACLHCQVIDPGIARMKLKQYEDTSHDDPTHGQYDAGYFS